MQSDWREEFGIGPADTKIFFAAKSDLAAGDTPPAQIHVLRRAAQVR
jgi:hypothetical protein